MPIAFGVHNRNDLEHFHPPDPKSGGRMDKINRAADLRSKGRDLAFIGAVRGPFANTAYHFVGMVDTMMAIYDDPEFLKLAFQMTVDFDIEICQQYADSGVDIFWITEDIAGNKGPLIKPAHYRELALPYLCRLLDFMHSLGKPVVFHSDGNVIPFLEDLILAGITGLDPIERYFGYGSGGFKSPIWRSYLFARERGQQNNVNGRHSRAGGRGC